MSERIFHRFAYDCTTDGCFNIKHRLNFERWFDCFPGGISPTDIDGIVEINGRFLVLEWKQKPRALPKGQQIMFDNMLRLPERAFTILVMAGDAEGLKVSHVMHYHNRDSTWKEADFDDTHAFIRMWASWARDQALPQRAA